MHIRPWRLDDGPALAPLIVDFLRVNLERGGDVLATERNVMSLIATGMLWSNQGCPTLVAERDDGGLLGYLLWGWHLEPPLDYRWKTCFALGTYVVPAARRMGVAAALRAAARQQCAQAGIERIVGTVHLTNPLSVQDLTARGWWPTVAQMETLV